MTHTSCNDDHAQNNVPMTPNASKKTSSGELEAIYSHVNVRSDTSADMLGDKTLVWKVKFHVTMRATS